MKVYVKTDADGRITAVESAVWLHDLTEWTEVDDGEGDKYNLAQSHYFPLPLMDDNGIYRYKFVDETPTERTAEEMAADLAAIPAPPYQPTDDERLDALEAAVLELVLGGAV